MNSQENYNCNMMKSESLRDFVADLTLSAMPENSTFLSVRIGGESGALEI
jgi:hypothetical protein